MPEELEYLDIVNDDDIPIDYMERSQVYRHNVHNFRMVYALIENSDKELWIPRRTKHKAICPSHLDASMGGHVTRGETYETALARELEEELRLEYDEVEISYLGKLSPKKDDSYAFSKVYKIIDDKEPDYNPDDFVEAIWLTPEDILVREQEGDLVKSDLVVIARALLDKRL